MPKWGTPTGARWSAGALWAEDGNPQADDSDWEDNTAWPKAYSATDAIAVGVYVEGLDVLDDVYSVSWGLGQSEPLPAAVWPSSCSLSMRFADGAFDPLGFAEEGFEPIGSSTPSIGARVVVLTEWDVLWVGSVESASQTDDVERSTLQIQATDDLIRATFEGTYTTGGDLFGAIDTLLVASGITGSAYTLSPGDTTAYDFGLAPDNTWYQSLIVGEHVASPLTLIAGMVWACCCAAAWTPGGLRIAPLSLEDDSTFTVVDDDWDQLRSVTRGLSIQTVRNEWTLEANDGSSTYGADYDSELKDSSDVYGVRKQDVSMSDWRAAYSDMLSVWWNVMFGAHESSYDDWQAFVDPVPTMSARTQLASKRHKLSRALPFDLFGPESERYRILRVQHDLTPDSWAVNIEGIGVTHT